MEKIIIVDGKEIRLKSTGATLLRYKAQFNKDALGAITALEKCFTSESFQGMDFEVVYNLVWTMAKAANPDIKPPLEWLDDFDEFPLMDILPEVFDLIQGCFSTTKKKQVPEVQTAVK